MNKKLKENLVDIWWEIWKGAAAISSYSSCGREREDKETDPMRQPMKSEGGLRGGEGMATWSFYHETIHMAAKSSIS